MQTSIITRSGEKIFVSPEDYDHLSQFGWWISRDKKTKYKQVRGWVNGKIVKLHRYLLGITDKNIIVDHINGDTFDCRRENLRPVTKTQNMMNRRRLRPGYKGVSRRGDRWIVRIKVGGKSVWRGYFKCEHRAAAEYNKAALEFYGEYANLNTIQNEAKCESEVLPDAQG